jgi:hypothetical protein
MMIPHPIHAQTLSIMPETRRDSSRLKRLKEDSIEKSSLPAPPAF